MFCNLFKFISCEIVLNRNTLLDAKRENVTLLSLQKDAKKNRNKNLHNLSNVLRIWRIPHYKLTYATVV